jgi:hypothetical protein
MAAILDRQNGRRYDEGQFTTEVVDRMGSEQARRQCHELIEALQARQAGEVSSVTSVTLGDAPGIPASLQGAIYDLVYGPADAERYVSSEIPRDIQVRIENVHTLRYVESG